MGLERPARRSATTAEVSEASASSRPGTGVQPCQAAAVADAAVGVGVVRDNRWDTRNDDTEVEASTASP
jgi:hypothetical protein